VAGGARPVGLDDRFILARGEVHRMQGCGVDVVDHVRHAAAAIEQDSPTYGRDVRGEHAHLLHGVVVIHQEVVTRQAADRFTLRIPDGDRQGDQLRTRGELRPLGRNGGGL
jgi:hypothetical protein